MTTYTTLDSPVGELLLVGEETPAGAGPVSPVTLTSVPAQRPPSLGADGLMRGYAGSRAQAVAAQP